MARPGLGLDLPCCWPQVVAIVGGASLRRRCLTSLLRFCAVAAMRNSSEAFLSCLSRTRRRFMRAWQDEGLVQVGHGRVSILDKNRLRALVGPG